MKGFKKKSDALVPIPSRKRDEAQSPSYALALEVGELRMLSEKLLYRVQQCERREKNLLNANRSLRRELTALKSQILDPGKKRVNRPKPEPSEPPPRHTPPTIDDRSDSGPNFGAALDDLNSRRH